MHCVGVHPDRCCLWHYYTESLAPTRNHVMQRALKVLLIVAFGLLPVVAARSVCPAEENDANEVTQQVRENAVAIMAKLLCSGIFVCNREPQEFINNDLQRPDPRFPNWEEIEIEIDRQRNRVTLSAPGVPPRTAVYNGDQGCTLLARGADGVFFSPVPLHTTLPDASTTPWPIGDLIDDEAPSRAVDEAALDAALDIAFDDSLHAVPQKTRAMVVLHKGRIIGERYAPGFDKNSRHISWSMSKSITSALIGILVGQGHFAVDDLAPVAEWRDPGDPRRKITIADLLHMSSGLRFNRGTGQNGLYFTEHDNHTAVYFGAVDVFEYSIHRELEHPPNTVWRYRNCDPLSLGKIIRDTVESQGGEYLSFPQRALFDRIGARNYVLEADPWGNFIMTGFDYGTARDWARFGLLHLHDGVFAGERVLPEGWVDFVRTPAPASPGKSYGALFWLNAGKQYENLPSDMYWPAGHHGQVVMIIPSREMVVVRLGHSARGGFGPYIAAVMERILGAVETAGQ